MANQSPSYIVIGSQATNLTVFPAPASMQVLVTPLSSRSQQLVTRQLMIKKVLLKAVNRGSKGKGKEPKVFTLRNTVPDRIASCNNIKSLIRMQLIDDITEDDFDIGHLQGSTVVNIRSKADLDKIWELLRKRSNLTLWCDVISHVVQQNSSRKKVSVDEDDEVQVSKGKKKKDDVSKEEKLYEAMHTLQAKHGKDFTSMRYRIWTEMHTGGYMYCTCTIQV